MGANLLSHTYYLSSFPPIFPDIIWNFDTSSFQEDLHTFFVAPKPLFYILHIIILSYRHVLFKMVALVGTTVMH
mgnify:CR=1 FL=1